MCNHCWITPAILCATEQRKSLKIRVNIQTMKQRRGVVYMHLHTPFLLFLRWISVLVLDGVQLKLFLRDSIVPWFRFSIRIMLITQCCFTIKKSLRLEKPSKFIESNLWLFGYCWAVLALSHGLCLCSLHLWGGWLCTRRWRGHSQEPNWPSGYSTPWNHAQPIAGKLATAWEPTGHHLGSREQWYCASLDFYILII